MVDCRLPSQAGKRCGPQACGGAASPDSERSHRGFSPPLFQSGLLLPIEPPSVVGFSKRDVGYFNVGVIFQRTIKTSAAWQDRDAGDVLRTVRAINAELHSSTPPDSLQKLHRLAWDRGHNP
jgi:hypothetical protein